MNAPQRLEELRPQIQPFPPLTYGGANNEMVDMIESLPPGGMVLDERYFGALSERGLKVGFEEDDDLMEGRRGGVHQSYAGHMSFESDVDQPMLRTVFVKPYRDEKDCRGNVPAQQIVHEVATSSAVAALYPYPVTFKALGIAKSRDGTQQLITEYSPPITAIGNMLRPKQDEAMPTSGQITEGVNIAMDQAGTWIGGLASTHGDFHASNVARGIENKPWFNDNETVNPLEKEHGTVVDSQHNRQRIRDDLSRFYRSLVNPKFIQHDVAEKVYGVLDDKHHLQLFLRAYQSSLQRNTQLTGNQIPERYFLGTKSFSSIVQDAIRSSR